MNHLYLVQWTIYAQRVVEAENRKKAVDLALEQGPDPQGSHIDDTDPPEAKRL